MRSLLTMSLLLLACGVDQRDRSQPLVPTPDPTLDRCLERCGGCCDANGQCLGGNSPQACGRSGSLCAVCATGFECSGSGSCREPVRPSEPAAPPSAGEVTFRWRFSGQACAVVRDVARVTVDIPGLSLPNGGSFPCSTGAADGITLPAVQPDLYRYTMRGLTTDGRLLYERTGTFWVTGPTLERIDLLPVPGATGRATLSLQLPTSSSSSLGCQGAGIATLSIQLPGRTVDTRCDAAMTGLSFGALPAGTQTLTVTGLSETGFALARGRVSLTVLAGAETFTEVSLSWLVGGASLHWSLTNDSIAQTCLQAGVREVFVNFQDSTGTFLYPGAGVAVACEQLGVVFPTLPAGTLTAFAQAVGSWGVLYRSAGVPITVRAGVFPTPTSASTLLEMMSL
jgi:hypothetical protein